MAFKLLNLLAVTSLAILACSNSATTANALSVDTTGHFARHPIRAHDAIAKKKRSKKCKPRVTISTTTTPSTTPAPVTTTKAATKATSTEEAAPKTTAKATTSSNSGSSSSSSGSSGSGKVGLGWPQDDDTALAHFKTDKVGYVYTWSPWVPDAAKKLGYKGIPMLWGDKQIDSFKSTVVKGYAEIVFGFNEPNEDGQSNMTPQHAADVWKQYIDPLQYQGYQLISPATTNAPSGKTWMQAFFSACDGCHFDGVAVHYYDTDPQGMIAYVQDFHSTFGLPVWPTEYACQNFGGGAQCSKGDVDNFMSTVSAFLDSASYVPAYFAFGAMYDMYNVNPLNQLLGSNGYPTALGYQYIN